MAAADPPTLARWNISAADDPTALDRYRDGLAGWYCASDFDEATLPGFFTDNVVSSVTMSWGEAVRSGRP